MTEVTKKDLQNWKEEIKKDSERWKDEIKKDSEHWKEEIVRQNQVMYEKFHAEVKVIGEQYLTIQKKIDALFEMVAKNSEDIELIKMRLTKIEADISEIKKTLETKADTEKIKKLEKDIVLLKQKIA